MLESEDGAEKWRMDLYKPLPGKKLTPAAAAQARQDELDRFAATFGLAPTS
jgi:hypothetical protein